MARAKRTDRAEARRQYRAYLASQQDAETAAAAEGAAEESQSRPAGRRIAPPAATGAPQPGQRMGMLGAAKAATRTPTYLADIRYIVPLVTRTRAVWPVALLCLAAAVISFPRIHSNADASGDPILSIVFQFILYPMALLPPMVAGFLAPRATWLAGVIAALISTGFFILAVAVTPIATASASTLASASPSAVASASAFGTASSTSATPSAAASAAASASAEPTSRSTVALMTSSELGGAAFSWLLTALPFGAVIGAGAGWYKRFLDNMGPRNGASRGSQQKRPVRKSQPTRR